MSENEPLHEPCYKGRFRVGRDFGPRGLDQPPVLHSGRTRGLTGAARQAEIDMLDVIVVDLHAPFGDLDHLIDAPARGIHLDAQLAVGRASVEAEPTVDTLVEVALLGSVEEGEVGGGSHRKRERRDQGGTQGKRLSVIRSWGAWGGRMWTGPTLWGARLRKSEREWSANDSHEALQAWTEGVGEIWAAKSVEK